MIGGAPAEMEEADDCDVSVGSWTWWVYIDLCCQEDATPELLLFQKPESSRGRRA
jgi:hypothetical protein